MGDEIFHMAYAKQLKEQVQALARDHHYRPWEIRQMTLSDIRRLFGPIKMPSRKIKRV